MTRFDSPHPIRRLLPPLLFLLAVPVLLQFLTFNVTRADAIARGIAGPLSWPRFALYGMFFCAAGWLVQTALRIRRELRSNWPMTETASIAPDDDHGVEKNNEVLIWFGIVLTLAYGFSIPVVGYALATMAYLVLWLLLGGIRKPVMISVITVAGTAVLLYVFVKLALMPLDRGQGVFGELSVAIYRMLKIY